MTYIGNCAMRCDLAQQVRKKMEILSPFWLNRLGEIDLYESRFEATIEDWTFAYTKFGARSFRIAVPPNVIGNRPIDGVTGARGGDDARTVIVNVQWCDSTRQEHPMIVQGSKSFDVSVEADQLFDWINRFVDYEPVPRGVFKHISSVARLCEEQQLCGDLGELSDWELVRM